MSGIEELADAAVSALQAALPDWLPRNALTGTNLHRGCVAGRRGHRQRGQRHHRRRRRDILSNFYPGRPPPGSAAGGQITVTFDSAVTTTIPAGTGFA